MMSRGEAWRAAGVRTMLSVRNNGILGDPPQTSRDARHILQRRATRGDKSKKRLKMDRYGPTAAIGVASLVKDGFRRVPNATRGPLYKEYFRAGPVNNATHCDTVPPQPIYA